MKIGIFSDTHSNHEALTAVLGAFKQEGVDKLVCLGDTVGYGASPNECCDLVRQVASFTILGNHDAAVAGRMDYSYYYDAARQALVQDISRDHTRALLESFAAKRRLQAPAAPKQPKRRRPRK